MEKSDIEKREEVSGEVGKTLRKIIGGFLPGTHVAESLWSFQNNLYEKRLMGFVESLRSVFEDELGIDLENYNLETEDFIGVLSSTLRSVRETKSEYKVERYRNILVKQVIDPIDDLMVQKYIQLLDDVNEVQLVILDLLRNEHSTWSDIENVKRILVKRSGMDIQEFFDSDTLLINVSNREVEASRDEIDFYIDDLVSRGLITKTQKPASIDNQMGSMSLPKPKFEHKVSRVAEKFLDFLRAYKSE